jgi:hypothetical protein
MEHFMNGCAAIEHFGVDFTNFASKITKSGSHYCTEKAPKINSDCYDVTKHI